MPAKKLTMAKPKHLEARRADIERLILRAPAAGIVLPPPEVPQEPRDDGRLAALLAQVPTRRVAYLAGTWTF